MGYGALMVKPARNQGSGHSARPDAAPELFFAVRGSVELGKLLKLLGIGVAICVIPGAGGVGCIFLAAMALRQAMPAPVDLPE